MLYVLAFIVIVLGTLIPPLWILREWHDEQSIKTSLALSGIIIHLLICIMLLAKLFDVPWGLPTYCALILFAIALNPIVGRIRDRSTLKTQRDEDIAGYLAAIERQPVNAALYAALAQAYLDNRRYDEAISAFEKAIELDPDHMQRERSRLRYAREDKQRLDARREAIQQRKSRGR